MSDPVPSPADPGLQHLEGKPFEAIVAWLKSALRGHESLPKVVPDESPVDPILRRERSLSRITRDDLREACLTLVRRFVRSPAEENDNDYVGWLLRLAKGFNLDQIVADLHGLATRAEAFYALPARQQQAILFTLLDLKAPLPGAFWQGVTTANPRLGVIAVSALLRDDCDAAMEVVTMLPGDEAVADALYVGLNQHARKLSPPDLQSMVALVKQVAPDCAPEIRAVLEEWLTVHMRQEATHVASSPNYDALKAALAHYSGKPFVPKPQSARLIDSLAAA
ncbi:MAG: hypothetical protein JWO08_575 [Verrucomicrobiaceae bacterium]|nr:hypothetical protein [Verrucomicrobiaceae bacterium]